MKYLNNLPPMPQESDFDTHEEYLAALDYWDAAYILAENYDNGN